MSEFRGETKYKELLEFRNRGGLSPVHSEGEYNEDEHNSLILKREHSFTLGRRAVPKFEKEDVLVSEKLRKKDDEANIFPNFESLIENED